MIRRRPLSRLVLFPTSSDILQVYHVRKMILHESYKKNDRIAKEENYICPGGNGRFPTGPCQTGDPAQFSSDESAGYQLADTLVG